MTQSCTLTLVLVVAVLAALATAQLNFSAGWGRRYADPNADPMAFLYRLIQIEARKLAGCSD
uniref:Adipokinetic prohormone type 2 n=1 Tax=Locusta migratoria TaxID=7004 RepID=AKH2_LOCMI|nr:RecName: Full=Adipokinetic prohormone type 2; Contains: RecName: Full=Adipokinetic hormone 2; AltName: Full=Adipokinetic hormone II; Short=AKH-II; Contains: RecName: Full=Adipokinetic hormone precursor-related peptide beta chain; Short=APRP-beta; AltName: Full=6 kDa dimeric peptide B; Flags: Precursor [Locusta migratoria]CAA60495.1 adipokinetic hormone II, adipokinetic-hormone-associated peptide II [Locusta migratoria]